MEREVKVAELAQIWGVSVPTTWNRIRKEGLETFLKKDENGKEINYISVSDEVIKKYVNNVDNNVNNRSYNGYYEELLTDNNVNEGVKTDRSTENNTISAGELFDRLTTLNKEYNDRLERLNNELLTSEKQRLLLEDKAGREGLYLKEINELKNDNERLINNNKKLFTTLLIIITILITSVISMLIFSNSDSINTKKNPAQQEEPTEPVKK